MLAHLGQLLFSQASVLHPVSQCGREWSSHGAVTGLAGGHPAGIIAGLTEWQSQESSQICRDVLGCSCANAVPATVPPCLLHRAARRPLCPKLGAQGMQQKATSLLGSPRKDTGTKETQMVKAGGLRRVPGARPA